MSNKETKKNEDNKTKEKNVEEEEFQPFSVILGRDLIFMDWTVQFGGQLLGILLAIILGAILGFNVFNDLFLSGGQVTSLTPITLVSVGTMLAVIALSVYYIIKLGIKLNSPKKIAGNKLNILKITFFGFAFILGMSNIYTRYLQPAANSIAGVVSPIDQGSSGNGSQTPTIQWSFNDYIIYMMAILLSVAVFALLYAGIMYSINRKVRTFEGVAVATSTILLMFYQLSQFSIPQYLVGAFQQKSYSLLLPFLTDLFYFMVTSLVIILVYHLSRRIELALILLFLGFGFGYDSSNVFELLIIMKYNFPSVSQTSAVLIKTLQTIQLVGMYSMIAYPVLFYKDTISFFKKSWKTLKKQGIALLTFFIVVLIIEIIIQVLYQFLSIIFSLIIFIVLVILVNSLITKRYGAESYTNLMKGMTQSTLQMTEPVVPPLRKQSSFLEGKLRRKRITILTLSTGIPVLVYFVIMYLTTAITSQTTAGEALFLYTAVPISVGVVAFAISFFFVKNPIPRGRFKYHYPLKIVGLIGGVFYFFEVISKLVYNEVGLYPLIAVFFVPMIILPLFNKDKLGTLLLTLAGDNTDSALKELVLRKEVDINKIEENFDKSPHFIRIWLALILTKRKDSVQINQKLVSMLDSKYPAERATAAMCLLYLRDQETIERLVNILENDHNPKVRNFVAYSLRYVENIPEDIYKRIIDSQHYEDDSQVLETIKKTLVELDMRTSSKEKEEEIEFEEHWEEL